MLHQVLSRDHLKTRTLAIGKPCTVAEAPHDAFDGLASAHTCPHRIDLLGALTLEMGREPRDILGELYMSLGAGNKDLGQFFTPYSVSQLLAGMTMGGAQEQLKSRDFISVYEPCSGGGAMLVAAVESLKAQGVNIHTQMHITAEDLSANAVHMTYVQLSLLDVPATVQRVNTLSREEFGEPWPTAAHLLDGWGQKLASRS